MSDDPVRLIDAPDPPAHLVELVRTLAPSSVPPAIRVNVRARLPRGGGGGAGSWRVIGPTLAVAAAIGVGVAVTWWIRETDPQPLPPRSAPPIVPVAEQPRPVVPPPVPPPAPEAPLPAPPEVPETLPASAPIRVEDRAARPPRPRAAPAAPAAEPPAEPYNREYPDIFRDPESPTGNLQIPDVFRRPRQDGPPAPEPYVPDQSRPPYHPPPPGAAAGNLTVQTMPWSRVLIDGRDTGMNTPIRSIRLTPGRHRLGLRTPDGTMHSVVIEIRADETLRVIRAL